MVVVDLFKFAACLGSYYVKFSLPYYQPFCLYVSIGSYKLTDEVKMLKLSVGLFWKPRKVAILHLSSFGNELVVGVGTTHSKTQTPFLINRRTQQLKLPAKMLGGSALKLSFLTRFGWENACFDRVTRHR